MSEANVETLSDRERACVEHFRQARELGVSFAEYCRSFEVNANIWYAVRRAMMARGVRVAGAAGGEAQEKPSAFVPVRVVSSPSSASVACRMRHASGWTIECTNLPEVSWIKALLAGECA